MSELQVDDPDPLPNNRVYLENYETGLQYEGHELSDYLAHEEQKGFERAVIVRLSNYASKVLESDYGTGLPTERLAVSGQTELYRKIADSSWFFSIIDTNQSIERCRAWVLGGDGVSWCEDEERYEPAEQVLERLMEAFPLQEFEKQPAKSRVKRMLALVGLRG